MGSTAAGGSRRGQSFPPCHAELRTCVAAHHVSHLPSCGLCREVGLGEEEVGPFTAQMSLMRAMCEESW